MLVEVPGRRCKRRSGALILADLWARRKTDRERFRACDVLVTDRARATLAAFGRRVRRDLTLTRGADSVLAIIAAQGEEAVARSHQRGGHLFDASARLWNCRSSRACSQARRSYCGSESSKRLIRGSVPEEEGNYNRQGEVP